MFDITEEHRIMEALTPKQIRTLLPFDSSDPIGDRPRLKSICAAMLRMNFEDKVWLIFNEFGLLSITVGRDEGEALDNAVDCDALDSCWVKYEELDQGQIEQYNKEGYISGLANLGNASELFDLNYISVREYR